MAWTFHSVLEKPEYWKWIAQRAQVAHSSRSRGIVAVNEEGDVDAGVAFDNWTHTSCAVHIAIENPFVIRAGFFDEVARYLFDVCERKILLGLTPGDNEQALRFNRRAGWVEVCRVPEGFNHGVDYVVQTMTPEQCRWYRRD